jgi:hypothetical protein
MKRWLLLALLGCGGFSPGPFACELDGTYSAIAVGKTSRCQDWSTELEFRHAYSALCRVPIGLQGYTGSVDCDTTDGIVQSCIGELHDEHCGYLLGVDRCEGGLCDE